jgi:hypothetical protein
MSACPFCGYKNRPGAWFCAGCGTDLYDVVADETLPTKEVPLVSYTSPAQVDVGITQFPAGSFLVVYLRKLDTPLSIQVNKRIILGRFHAGSALKPDVDLTPYGGVEKGVSRIHAAIEPVEDTLILTDLGSSNGTYVNGHRLASGQPRVIRDGDEIHLGKFLLYIYFAHRKP